MENVIAYNEFAGNHYWATTEQYKGKGKSVYIIDPPGDKQLREEVGCEVVTIFLTTPRDTAWERMIIDNRGVCNADKRVEHDAEVFAAVKTDWVVDTDRGIKEVIADIGRIIETY
jgi:guanylate kinase